jgi:hypothetical protein
VERGKKTNNETDNQKTATAGKGETKNAKENKKRDEIEDKIEKELYGDLLANNGGAGFSDIEDAQSVKPSMAKRKQKKKDSSDDDDDSDVFSDQGRK